MVYGAGSATGAPITRVDVALVEDPTARFSFMFGHNGTVTHYLGVKPSVEGVYTLQLTAWDSGGNCAQVTSAVPVTVVK